jgi:hypothetical protein
MDDNATPPLPPELAVLVAGDSAGRTGSATGQPPRRCGRSCVRRTAGPACGHCCSNASTPILRWPGPPARSTHNRAA